MIQRMVTHPSGTFPPCLRCGREPKHYLATGRTTVEQTTHIPITERHLIECCCAGTAQRTAFHPRLADAKREWRDRLAITALALGSMARKAA